MSNSGVPSLETAHEAPLTPALRRRLLITLAVAFSLELASRFLLGLAANPSLLAEVLSISSVLLACAAIATLVNFFIGVFYGGLAGYLGGRVDTLMMRFVEVISTIPLTLYVILIMVVFNSGFFSVIIAIGSVYWVDMARIVRGQILTLKQQDYVAAARTMGASTGRILTRHLLPNSIGPILVALTMLIPSAIFIESFISFIGLGVTPP